MPLLNSCAPRARQCSLSTRSDLRMASAARAADRASSVAPRLFTFPQTAMTESPNQQLRFGLFADRCKVRDVGEKNDHIPADTAQRVGKHSRVLQNLVHQIPRD